MAKSRFPVWVMAILLALVTMALYWPTTGYDFINFDDDLFVTSNVHVQEGLTLESIKWACLNPVCYNWHPLTVLSHIADCQLYGLKPWGHHLTSVLLHAVNTMLVFLLLRGLTGALWRSVLVAAMFGWHPVHVESVAWVAERKDVLSAFFGLLALMAYARYAEVQSLKSKVQSQESAPSIQHPASSIQPPASRLTPHAFRSRPPSFYYILALVLFALGLMSKPMLVTWPFVMLLLDYWPLRRFEPAASNSPLSTVWRLVREKIPFIALAAGTSVVTFLLQKRTGILAPADVLPFGARVGNALISYGRYLGKLFWPTDLAFIYPHPGHWPMEWVLLAGVLLLGISGLLLVQRRRYPFLLMGWLWYGGTLLPVIQLVQTGNHAMADRYTYIPSLGVLILVTWGAYELTRRWRHQVMALSVAGSMAIVLCFALTRQQLGYWKESETLFRHALAVTKDNWLAHDSLGAALGSKGLTDEAIRQFQEALRLKPGYADAYYNLGSALLRKGQPDAAICQFQEALRFKPDDARTHENLGVGLGRKGQMDEAIRQFQEALRLKPDDASACYNLGNALLLTGHTDAAISQFRKAVRLQPENADAHNSLGVALGRKGQLDEAIRQYQQALRLKPDWAEAHNNFGNALGRKGRTDEAINQFRAALRLKPDYAEAHYGLGAALASKGQSDEAIRQYQEALRLNPDYVEAHYGLGAALANKGQPDEAIRQYQEALRLKPDYAQARYGLGVAFTNKGQPDEAIRQYQEALRLNPDYTEARKNLDNLRAEYSKALGALASALDGEGKYAQAIQLYQTALKTRPGQEDVLNNLAWLLATCPDAAFRNGPEAVRLATRACELTGYAKPLLIGTLAAAQAEAGAFAAAIATAERAAALATDLHLQEIAARNRELLELYRQGQPFHENKREGK